jgi:hypothetical protein
VPSGWEEKLVEFSILLTVCLLLSLQAMRPASDQKAVVCPLAVAQKQHTNGENVVCSDHDCGVAACKSLATLGPLYQPRRPLDTKFLTQNSGFLRLESFLRLQAFEYLTSSMVLRSGPLLLIVACPLSLNSSFEQAVTGTYDGSFDYLTTEHDPSPMTLSSKAASRPGAHVQPDSKHLLTAISMLTCKAG